MTTQPTKDSFIFKLAGTFAYPLGKPVMKGMKAGDAVTIQREPTNKYDPLAMQVIGKNEQGEAVTIGYVPKDLARKLASANIISAEKHPASWDAFVVHFEEYRP